MSQEIPEKRCWKWLESGRAMGFVRKHAVARGVWGMHSQEKDARDCM